MFSCLHVLIFSVFVVAGHELIGQFLAVNPVQNSFGDIHLISMKMTCLNILHPFFVVFFFIKYSFLTFCFTTFSPEEYKTLLRNII